MYAEDEHRHADRMAAIQRHFGEQITSRGDPDADHALMFVAEHDPERQFGRPPQELEVAQVVEINYNGMKREVRLDANGRVVAGKLVADGSSRRTSALTP
jgi:hypothetical protein